MGNSEEILYALLSDDFSKILPAKLCDILITHGYIVQDDQDFDWYSVIKPFVYVDQYIYGNMVPQGHFSHISAKRMTDEMFKI